MMKPEECSEAWKTVIKVYDETIGVNNPRVTINKIVDELGLDKTKEVFATVSSIKKGDGRIYGRNREYMNSIPVNPDAVKWDSDNPMLRSNLDHIHTAHISNLITELRKIA